jgi:hypothetical protein
MIMMLNDQYEKDVILDCADAKHGFVQPASMVRFNECSSEFV